jgi:hypothetical protein
LREGEQIINHGSKGEGNTRVLKALDLPGSLQIGYLASFFNRIAWWNLKPAPELLTVQPGTKTTGDHISVSRTDDRKTIVVYTPRAQAFSIYNPGDHRYEAEWFDVVANKTAKASVSTRNGVLTVSDPPGKKDHVLLLSRLDAVRK